MHEVVEFTLNKLKNILPDYSLPKIQGSPGENQTFTYEMLSIGPGRAVNQGYVSYSICKASSSGASDEKINKIFFNSKQKAASGYFRFRNAELMCRKGLLYTPLKWKWSSKTAKNAEDEAYMNSGIQKEAEIINNYLIIKTNDKVKSVPLEEKYTLKWCLPNVVAGINAVTLKEPLRFTMINDFDQIAGPCELSYVGRFKKEIGNILCDLSAFLVKGSGLLPTVYIKDSFNRVIFTVSGLEIYKLISVDNICLDDL